LRRHPENEQPTAGRICSARDPVRARLGVSQRSYRDEHEIELGGFVQSFK